MSRELAKSKVWLHWLWACALGVVTLGLGILVGPSEVAATPPQAVETTQPPALAAPPTQAAQDAGVATAPPPPIEPTTAMIIFATTPPATATVVWGRKALGKITPGKPLVVVRPRDSGPLDVVVRADGYLPVQTRAHTFSDNRVVVKLTKPANVNELFGYRTPVDAGVPPEQAAALDAVTPATPNTPAPWAPAPTFRVVPATPSPSPFLVPP